MSLQQVAAALIILSTLVSEATLSWAAVDRAPVPAAPPSPPDAPESADGPAITPPRVSYLGGDVSFWRPGAEAWAPAALNTPLAPGDVLYAAAGGNVEIQIGTRAFVRAGDGTQIGVDNQELDFLQLRVTSGHASLDVRALDSGHTVEVDTANAAFTIERAGYYHVDAAQGVTTFRVHRGGSATMTSADGAAAPIAANQQVVITGAETPRVDLRPAIELTAWDQWNYQRTDQLLQHASAPYVAPTVYGAEALVQHGSWRTVEQYGPVWVPRAVPVGWVPYSTGRWIWDPRFGWTWLDDAPWGWAPYHYGRWVFVGNHWAWAPGPVVVRPAYAPALTVFLGGPVSRVGHPICWAPLGWGEPLIPWWGRPGFVGVAWWGGWGGPRVVNNVVVNRATIINVTNIRVYKNVHVTNAVVGVDADRFGHGAIRPARINAAAVRDLSPVRGAPSARPPAASLMPASGPAVKPPAATQARAVVATRAPHDATAALRAHDLAVGPTAETARARLVPAPKAVTRPPSANAATRGDPGPGSIRTGGSPSDSTPGRPEEKIAPRPAPPHLPSPLAPETTTSRPTPPPAEQRGTTEHGQANRRLEPLSNRPAPTPRVPTPQAPSERAFGIEPPIRAERAPRVAPPVGDERPLRVESPASVARPPRVEPPASAARVPRVEPPARTELSVRTEPAIRVRPASRGESPVRVEPPGRGNPPARVEPPRTARPARGEAPARAER